MFDPPMEDLTASDLYDEASRCIALPVYEGRIGNEVQKALIDNQWLPTLRDLNLHYWFIGDKREGQPILRRTIGAIDQHGRRRNINFSLHRVIATAVRLGQMPATLQALYDEMQKTPSIRLGVILGPEGYYDFRNQNLLESNRQHGRHARLISVQSNDAEITPQEIAVRQSASDTSLRRQALEIVGLSEEQFALLAKPGDDLPTLNARREAQDEGPSLVAKLRELTEKAEQERLAAEQAKDKGEQK